MKTLIKLLIVLSCLALFSTAFNGIAGSQEIYVFVPDHPAPGKPWVWYAPITGTPDFWNVDYLRNELLDSGIGFAGIKLKSVRGAPKSTAEFTKFYESMVAQGWSEKPILLGQSRGGLMMTSWAIANPDKVSGIIGIYPVMNLKSWPLLESKEQTLADYEMTEEELLSRIEEFNPIDNLQSLEDNQIPIFIISGDSDVVVPFEDNGGIVEDRYDGLIKVVIVPGFGHTPVPEVVEHPSIMKFVKETI